MQYSPYKDPEYRAAKQWLKANPAACWECGKPAVTPDHHPPLAKHDHQRGTRCCQLRPHCRACSNRQGGTMGAPSTRLPIDRWFG